MIHLFHLLINGNRWIDCGAVLISSILRLVVIKCLWLPVAILLFGAYQDFFVVFYNQLRLLVLRRVYVVKAMFSIKPCFL